MKIINTIENADSKRLFFLNIPVYYEKITPISVRRRFLCFRWTQENSAFIKKNETNENIKTVKKEEQIADVSIIVPVFNAGAYLKKAVDSLLDQENHNLEFIFIDDASTDNSYEILRSYTGERIKVVRCLNNQGVAAARNLGIAIATGKYIGFMDPDDFVSQNYFGHLYKIGRINDADIVLTTTIKRVNVDGDVVGKKFAGIGNKTNPSIRDRMRILLTTGIAWNKIYKREFLQTNNICFPEIKTMGTDNYFSALSLIFAKNIKVTDKATYYYRENPTSIIRKKKDASYYKLVDVYAKLILRLDNSALNKQRKDEWNAAIRYRAVNDFHSNLKGFAEELERKDFCSYVNKNFDDMKFGELERPVISLTSYPARVSTLHLVIESLKKQNTPIKKIILWLAKPQFVNLKDDLPNSLLALEDDKFEIRWVNEDIRSYKKLIPALKNFPTDVIITADDDVIYPEDWAERLLKSYATDTRCIHCLRGRQIKITNEEISDYKSWKLIQHPLFPAFEILPTGVGGCLYKRDLLDEGVLESRYFMEIAKDCDDLWFWAMAVKKGTRIKVATPTLVKPNIIVGTQDTALWNVNMSLNDHYFHKILLKYPDIREKLIQRT